MDSTTRFLWTCAGCVAIVIFVPLVTTLIFGKSGFLPGLACGIVGAGFSGYNAYQAYQQMRIASEDDDY